MTGLAEGFALAVADRYRVDREIGQGGMATVYLAHDLRHQRQVAVKVLRPDVAASLGPERFKREIDIAARLQHPHILPLYESGETAGFLYYVMPFVDGQTLRERLVREGELPTADVVKILRDVVDGMAAAHEMGVVHRDLKPENVMLSGRHALVADFGVAKAVSEAARAHRLTTAGVAMGTPAYMAPEQAAGDTQTDHRADIYALGVLAYEMLTGDPPFNRSTPRALMAAQVTEKPVPVTERRDTVPPALAALVMRCLAKKPADRPQHAEELLQVLESLATPSGGLTPVDVAPVRPHRSTARTRLGFAVAGAGALALAVVAWFVVLREPALPDAGVREPIVVLPFTVRDSDPALQALGKDAADQVAAAIQGNDVGNAVIYGRSSEGQEFTRLAARALHAVGGGTLITGAIAKRGDQIELEARFIRGSDLRIIWALGPERASSKDPALALDRLRERVLAAAYWYLSPHWGRVHRADAYQPPPTLAIARLAETGAEYVDEEEEAAAVPWLQQAYARDTTWLAPLVLLQRAFGRAGRGVEADSLYRFLMARRERLTEAETARLEHFQAYSYGSPGEEVRTAKKLFATDSPYFADHALVSHVKTRRPNDALRYYALRDTTLDPRSGRPDSWSQPAAMAATAYHMLEQYDKELQVAQVARSKQPQASSLWRHEASALALLGRTADVDRLITESHTLENPAAPVWILVQVAIELSIHGHEKEARVFARKLLTALDRWPEPRRSSAYANRFRYEAWRILGQHDEIRRAVAHDLPTVPSLDARIEARVWRVIAGDTAGSLAFVDSVRAYQPKRSEYTLPGNFFFAAAPILAYLGLKEEAVDMLRQALNGGSRFETDDQLSWRFGPILDYPPFLELVKIR